MESDGSQAITVDSWTSSWTGVDIGKKYVGGRERVLETNNKQRAALARTYELFLKRRDHMTSGLFPLLRRLPSLTRLLLIDMSPLPTSPIMAFWWCGDLIHLRLWIGVCLDCDKSTSSVAPFQSPLPLYISYRCDDCARRLSISITRRNIAFSQCCLKLT